MIKAVIIEDEDYAVKRLISVLQEVAPDINVEAVLGSIEDSVRWLSESGRPDLAFMDVHLSDGNCFEIFRMIEPDFPVIFVTAYDQYAIQAFRVNGLDYLLKPVKSEELSGSLKKFRGKYGQDLPSAYGSRIRELALHYQKRLLVRFGNTIKAVDFENIAYFFAENKGTMLRTFEKNSYPVDHTLDELENIVNPSDFFRINRKLIVNSSAIDSMFTYSRSRIKLILVPAFEGDAIVSTERSPGFRQWLTGVSLA